MATSTSGGVIGLSELGEPKELLPAAGDRRPGARAALLLAVAGLGVYQLVALAQPGDLHRAAVAFLVGWVLCVALLASRGHGGIYRPAAAYVTVFGLFHGGLLVSFLLRGEVGLPSSDVHWFFNGQAPVAATLASVGMITFTCVSSAVAGRASPRLDPRTSPVERRVLGALGLGVQVAGLVILSSLILRGGGLGLLQSGYADFLAAAQGDGLLPYGLLALGVGPVLAVAAGGRPRLFSWSLFALYAAFAFPLGLRGEVLFPLVAMLVVEVRRGRRIRPLWTVVGALVVMTLIGAVRETRDDGAGALLRLSALSSPLDAVAEMGYSLRPTMVVLGWHGAGEPMRHGETFIAVPARAIENILGSGAPPYDDRLFNSEILARAGPIGGSPIAEGYHNFGTAGVIGFMAMLGALIGVLDRTVRTPLVDALLGAFLVIFLIQVRNSFAAIPLQVLLVVALLGVARVLTRGHSASLGPEGGGTG